jgi:virulence-associated protein VapD
MMRKISFDENGNMTDEYYDNTVRNVITDMRIAIDKNGVQRIEVKRADVVHLSGFQSANRLANESDWMPLKLVDVDKIFD